MTRRRTVGGTKGGTSATWWWPLPMTPVTAVASQADLDRSDAELRDMTPEQWAEVDAEVAKIEADNPGVFTAFAEELSRLKGFRPKGDQ